MSSAQGRGNGLGPTRIVDLAAASLEENVNLQNAYEAVALVGHACMLAVDFRLIGLEEDHSIEETEHSSTRLPREWNTNSSYAFKYAHTQSSMQYLLKVSRLGGKAVVLALALGDDKTISFDIPVKDYVSESSLPLSDSAADLSRALHGLFISRERLEDLISLYKVNVIQRLAPGLQKEGYEDTRQEGSSGQRSREEVQERPPRSRPDPGHMPEPARPYPFDDPLRAPPRNPVPVGDFAPPGFENEYEIGRPPRGQFPGDPGPGGPPPFNIGERDLYPPGLGPRDPLRGSFGPSGGGFGGGMHPTFDDPLFRGNRDQEEGRNPQAPPGARYDPVGPGDGPPFGGDGGFGPPPGRFGGPGGSGRGGFGGGFGGGII